MKDCTDASLRLLAAAAANFLIEGQSVNELRRLHALLILIAQNLQTEITLMSYPVTGPCDTPKTNIPGKDGNDYKGGQ